MTVSVPHDCGHIWTIDDLAGLPDGVRYEIADGSLLVSPPPALPHIYANTRLRRMLDRDVPTGLLVVDCGPGINIARRTTCYVPDALVVREDAVRRKADVLQPSDVLLVAEVLSPSNAGIDLVQKRHDYAAAGIPQYWIVDPRDQTITVLALLDGATAYKEEVVVRAGEPWQTGTPYPMTVDPAEIF
jgi:Uma2 family endonuclease